MTDKKISRRGFMKRLAACAVAISFLPKILEARPEMVVGVDKALEGSDNTSVYMVEWGKGGNARIVGAEKSMDEMNQEIAKSLFYGDVEPSDVFSGLRVKS